MRAIKYVGKKDSKTDATTGLTWKQGETLMVEDGKAARLLAHPDVWADVTGKKVIPDPEKVPEPEEVEQAEQAEQNDQPLANLDGMTRAQLSEFAMREFGIGFKANEAKGVMIETLRIQVGRNNVR